MEKENEALVSEVDALKRRVLLLEKLVLSIIDDSDPQKKQALLNKDVAPILNAETFMNEYDMRRRIF